MYKSIFLYLILYLNASFLGIYFSEKEYCAEKIRFDGKYVHFYRSLRTNGHKTWHFLAFLEPRRTLER